MMFLLGSILDAAIMWAIVWYCIPYIVRYSDETKNRCLKNSKYCQENKESTPARYSFLQGKRSCRNPGELGDDVVQDLIQDSLEALMRAEQNLEKSRAEFRKNWEYRK